MDFKKGQRVKLSADDRTVNATVMLASPNGRSLLLQFEALLLGYVCMMPVFREDDGGYTDLFTRTPIKIEALQ